MGGGAARIEGRRMLRIAALTLLLATLLAAPARAYDDAGYLAYMDRMEQRLDSVWNDAHQRYEPGHAGTDATFNANMLLVHSVAALYGHDGASRRDGRARVLVRDLLHSPPYVTHVYPGAGAQTHAPGWETSMTVFGDQHVMIDAEVVDGLAHAWLARRRLGLSRHDAARIAGAIHRVARGSFWRWPSIRLNQFNWYALIYAADATVGGGGELLRHDLAAQIHRFASGARLNFGPGLHFHYVPYRPASIARNVDSAEYANIVASFTRFYLQARRAGMRPPSRADHRVLAGWLTRVLAGYWTHGGYLNWDTGLGFHRWHQAKKVGLSQQALIGMASAPTLLAHRSYAGYAKWILDRGLDFYERTGQRAGGLAPGLFFGVDVLSQPIPHARLGAAREASNAARALEAGLGRAPGIEPPPLYAYDPDIGRLAITTPSYNTAIVAVSQGAFPYGGLEPARLFDGNQEVAANIGGRGKAAFGLLVRDMSGRTVLSTQTPRRRLDPRVAPLRVAGLPGVTSARRAYAGAFRSLRAVGTVAGPKLSARVSHRFTARFVDSRWVLRRRAGATRARYTVDSLFPSWGSGARIDAILRDGRMVRVGRTRLALAAVRRFVVRSNRSGYTVVVRRAPAGTSAHLLHPRPQSSDPQPGPTLALQLARRARVGRVELSVRIAIGPA
jgi:hypothetical protein